MEIDDVSENINGVGSVTRDLIQSDLPVTESVPEPITQSQVEDDEIDTLVEDGASIGEGNETCIAEEEGVVHVEEEGVVHEEKEGASANTDGRNNDTGNNEGTTQGGAYNLRPNRSREYSHQFDPQVYDVTNMHASHAPKEAVTVAQRMFGFVLTRMSAWAGIKNVDKQPVMRSLQNLPNWITKGHTNRYMPLLSPRHDRPVHYSYELST